MEITIINAHLLEMGIYLTNFVHFLTHSWPAYSSNFITIYYGNFHLVIQSIRLRITGRNVSSVLHGQ